MSTFEKGYGLLKSVMLMGERFDGLERRIAAISDDLTALAQSHVRVGERVADIEGYLRAATGTPFGDKPRLEKKMSDSLPEWYPLANASDEEIDGWLAAEAPPYDQMREAMPWLDEEHEFDMWIAGLREARSRIDAARVAEIPAGFPLVPLPPRRLLGRMTP